MISSTLSNTNIDLPPSTSVEKKRGNNNWIEIIESIEGKHQLGEKVEFFKTKPQIGLEKYIPSQDTCLESYIRNINTSASSITWSPVGSNLGLIGVLSNVEGSSTLKTLIGDALKELSEIVYSVSLYTENDEINPEFREKMMKWFIKYNHFATEIIDSFITDHSGDDSLNIELLELLGEINDASSFKERVILLNNYLQNKNPKLRYGAIKGISNTNSTQLKTNLEASLKRETVPILKNTLFSILEQLK